MVILVDADSTLIETHKAVLELYRQSTGDYSTNVDSNTEWDIAKICPKWDRRKVNNVFRSPKLFQLMQPIDNSVEITKKLGEEGHRVVILTIHRHLGITYKGKMLKRLFPHIKEVVYIDNFKNKMFKDLVKGDIIIDDVPDNLESNPSKVKICFGNYVYNRDYVGIHASGWNEVYNIIQFVNARKELFL